VYRKCSSEYLPGRINLENEGKAARTILKSVLNEKGLERLKK
jgi:hypothetical protein